MSNYFSRSHHIDRWIDEDKIIQITAKICDVSVSDVAYTLEEEFKYLKLWLNHPTYCGAYDIPGLGHFVIWKQKTYRDIIKIHKKLRYLSSQEEPNIKHIEDTIEYYILSRKRLKLANEYYRRKKNIGRKKNKKKYDRIMELQKTKNIKHYRMSAKAKTDVKFNPETLKNKKYYEPTTN